MYEVFGVSHPTQNRLDHTTRSMLHFIDAVAQLLSVQALICEADGVQDQFNSMTKYHFQISFEFTDAVIPPLVTQLRLSVKVGGILSATTAVVVKPRDPTLEFKLAKMSSAAKNNIYDVEGLNPITENIFAHATRLTLHFIAAESQLLSVQALTWTAVGVQDQFGKAR
ncbi:MAG: hypothetical protein ACD_2C00180G0001 [uncultured bacterium (gcode 4)]|uniref:Uncharacterized protein n=1 Tax=uncultured bacterium (gcode 4) TaxID=1234023 RepID=K2G2H9_9BACT|nr:MAG: hypothetical protein ACD_2C00180G0001 [uncultured bacterium (gcode 4)]